MTRFALESRGLVRDLGEQVRTRILHGIDLAVEPGEWVSITGPSGSGKSTLLYLLGALDRATEGDVLIDGRSTAALDDLERGHLRAEHLGFVFQFHFLLPEFTALENVVIPMLRSRTISRAEARARARQTLTELGVGELVDRRPAQMSGGQQQRVAIARAIAHRPRIVLADEPTGNLDSAAGAAVMDIFEHLAGGGMTVVMVTHEAGFAARTAREIQLRDGRVVDVVRHAPRA